MIDNVFCVCLNSTTGENQQLSTDLRHGPTPQSQHSMQDTSTKYYWCALLCAVNGCQAGTSCPAQTQRKCAPPCGNVAPAASKQRCHSFVHTCRISYVSSMEGSGTVTGWKRLQNTQHTGHRQHSQHNSRRDNLSSLYRCHVRTHAAFKGSCAQMCVPSFPEAIISWSLPAARTPHGLQPRHHSKLTAPVLGPSQCASCTHPKW
jgi:hypothetical protein